MKKSFPLLMIFILIPIISACTPAAQTQVPSPTVELEPATATNLPTSPPSTNTSVPPTETAVPTATEIPVTEISFFMYHGGGPAGDWEKANVATFMELNPDIFINHRNLNIYSRPVPNSIDDRVNFDPPPDVMGGTIGGVFHDYLQQGLIADISDLWEENGWYDVYPQSVIDMVSVDGKQYWVPQAVQWHPVWFNTNVFNRHNLTPPETWEELLAVCDTLSAVGQTPFTVSVAGWSPPTARWFTYLNMRVNGPEFHESLLRGRESFTDPRVFAVFEHWQEMLDHNCFSERVTSVGYSTAATELINGDAAMYLLGEWLSESYPRGFPSQIDFFAFPVIDPEIPNAEIAHFFGSFLHADAQNPEEAREFLTYLGTVASQTTFVETLNRISMHDGVSRDIISEMYGRGIDHIAGASHLTALWELGTHEKVAEAGLRTFVDFLSNPSNIETYLTTLEEKRELYYGALEGE